PGGVGGVARPAPSAKKSMAAPRGSRMSSNLGDLADLDGAAAEMSVAPAYTRQTRNLAAMAAIAVQSGTTRYDLPAAVTIPDKSTTMVMLTDQRIPGE